MDNFFTMTKTIIGTCECDVAAMGAARARTGWPPKQLGKWSIQDTVNTRWRQKKSTIISVTESNSGIWIRIAIFAHIRGMNRAV